MGTIHSAVDVAAEMTQGYRAWRVKWIASLLGKKQSMDMKPRIHFTKPSITDLEVRYSFSNEPTQGKTAGNPSI